MTNKVMLISETISQVSVLLMFLFFSAKQSNAIGILMLYKKTRLDRITGYIINYTQQLSTYSHAIESQNMNKMADRLLKK